MKRFATNNQRKPDEFIKDAHEQAEAKKVAEREKLTDWELVCRASEDTCEHGPSCSYATAVESIFKANAKTVSQSKLAAALRHPMGQWKSDSRQFKQ